MDASEKTYRLARQKSAFALAWACLVFALVPSIGIASDVMSAKMITAGFIGITMFWLMLWGSFAYIVYRWAKSAKLLISSSNLNCDDIASLVGFSTRWENIINIEVSKMRLVLWLKEPSIPTTKLGQWVLEHSVIRPDIIDLSSFIEHWKSGELRQDFEKYAPHLFGSGNSKTNAA
jgi:hypothetical protein